MIAGLAETGLALDDPKVIAKAARAADFVLKNQKTKDGRLLRTYGAQPGQKPRATVNAYLEDYAFLIHGLLNLHDAAKDKKWLDEARALTDTMIQYHGDKKAGGYYFTANDHEKLFARSKDQYDGATPSGNSVATRNLVRLWIKTGEERYKTEAERTFKAFSGTLKTQTSGLCTMAEALNMYLEAKEGKKAPQKEEKKKEAKPVLSDSVVKIQAKASPVDEKGFQKIRITLKIADGWRVFANPAGDELKAGELKIKVTSKKRLDKVQLQYPPGKKQKDPLIGTWMSYQGEVTIKGTVRRAKGDTGPLEVRVDYQSSNDKSCICGQGTVIAKLP
jgi:hypothetical protein